MKMEYRSPGTDRIGHDLRLIRGVREDQLWLT